MPESLAGRSYAQVYRVAGRTDLHDYLIRAVRRAGAEPLYVSEPRRTPIFLGIQGHDDARIGVLCYPFRCNPAPIRGRPADEHRLQIRYGGEASWSADHPLGRDIAGVDTTIVVGVHLEADLIIGLDPSRYDPLPMGISIEFKQADLDQAIASGWHVWERENRPGRRRGVERVREGLETLVAFRPERLLAYVGFERNATGLGLDPPLRFRAAQVAAIDPLVPGRPPTHELEEEFDLSSRDILEIIANRTRLSVAVRGGVAEHHLLRLLQDSREVAFVEPIDRDGEPDLDVSLRDGPRVLVECKNVSPNRYADGSPKVEVQKTRSQQGDPAGRFYRPEQFEVVAACLFAVTGRWEYRFKATASMERHPRHPDRLAVLHRVDSSWSTTIKEALDGEPITFAVAPRMPQ
jgi:hypothetical protein